MILVDVKKEVVILIKNIYFGDVEGKDEAFEAKEKNMFEDIFYPGFHSYDEMLEAKKFLIVGRKGTGKTLLAEYFKNEQEKEDNIVKILDESDFILKKLEKINYRNISEQEMIIFWEYFFLTEIAKEVLSNISKYRKIISISTKRLEKALREKPFEVKKISMSTTDSLASTIAAVTDVKKSNFESGINAKSEVTLEKEMEESEYYNQIKDFSELIGKCFRKTKKNIYLIFDDLDELEVFAEIKESKITFIHSMVKTVKRLNQNYREKGIGIKIYLLMRQDMADDLNKTNNFNKIMNSNSISLSWEYNPKLAESKQPLSQMIIRKIRQSDKKFLNMSDEDIYSYMFPKRVSSRSFIKYLIDYSFGRPRDFVMLLNTIKEKYGEYEKVKPHYVANSISQYSKKFYKELENEIHRSPNRAILSDGLLLISDNQFITFSIAEIQETYRKNPKRYSAITNEKLIEDCLKELYKLSAIGTSSQMIDSKGKRKNVVEFYYRDNVISDPDLSNHISVHFALRSALNLIIDTKQKNP